MLSDGDAPFLSLSPSPSHTLTHTRSLTHGRELCRNARQGARRADRNIQMQKTGRVGGIYRAGASLSRAQTGQCNSTISRLCAWPEPVFLIIPEQSGFHKRGKTRGPCHFFWNRFSMFALPPRSPTPPPLPRPGSACERHEVEIDGGN